MAIVKTTDKDKLDFDSAVLELNEYFSSLCARKGRALTYNVLTYGCQLNESDSEKLSGMLSSMGLKASDGGELDDADVIWQTGELGKVDGGGGGTIAKFVANYNADVVDLGVPVLSMHAPMEVVSKLDVYMTYRALYEFYMA